MLRKLDSFDLSALTSSLKVASRLKMDAEAPAVMPTSLGAGMRDE